MVEVDIIIPVYRPGNDWAAQLANVFSNGLDTTHHYTVIVVNDGGRALNSDDVNTVENIADHSHIREVKIIGYEPNKGKGHAIRMGIEISSSPLIVYTDDDLPYGVEAINEMIELLNYNYQVVLPDRGRDYFQSLPFKRRIISRGLIWMNRLLMGMKHPDTQAGLKGFHRKVAEFILEGKENGFLFEVEWIKKAEKADVSIATTPVKLNDDTIHSGIPGGDVWKLLKTYVRLFRSR